MQMIDFYLGMAKDAAVEAGNFLGKRQDIHVDENLERDIKLSSDVESEKIIIDCLGGSKLPVLSEECGLVGSRDKLRWIVDPLDGTMNYYKGIDELCCVSIALFDGDEPLIGVVNRFLFNELYVGVAGRGSTLKGVPIKTSETESLKESVLATGFPSGMDMSGDSIAHFARRVQSAKKIRMLGSAALMATFVASGKVDVYFEQDIRLWDIAGAMAIINAAGGATKIQMKNSGHKCDFGAFANTRLMEEFYGV